MFTNIFSTFTSTKDHWKTRTKRITILIYSYNTQITKRMINCFGNSLNASIEIGFSPWKIERSKKLYIGTRHTFNEKVNDEQNIEDSDDGVILKSLNYLQQFFAGYQLKSLFFETGINLVNVNEIYIENDKKDISESTLTYIFPILSIGWRY